MAPPKPRAQVDIGDGVQRTLSVDMGVFMDFEEWTGKSLDAIGDQVSGSDLVMLLVAMMREHDPDVTVDHVKRHVHPGNIGELADTVAKLTSEAQPDGQEGESSPSPQTG